MKIKKFTAKSMPEAIERIRSELGDDAVILNSKEVETGGFLGFFTKKQLEVIVAIDRDQNRRPLPERKEPIPRKSKEKQQNDIQVKQKKDHVLNEINELKQLVHQLSSQMDSRRTASTEYPEPFQKIDDQLREHAVNEVVRLTIMKHLLKKWSEQSPSVSDGQITKDLHQYLDMELAKVPIKGLTFDKKIAIIVGPTGVGKTTTIAKIAAHCVLKKHKKVALITTDTYRIAAVEQLKTYAKILNIPLEVAYSIDDFKRATELFNHYDFIIVDSAGRNFRNPLYVDELSKVIDFDEQAEAYLTLSLTSKYEDMKEIIHQFSTVPIKQVILTKQDETSSLGALFNIPIELGKGIAYITNGQNVPDDLMEANIPYIKQRVLGEEENA